MSFAADDREAVGRFGQHAQRRAPRRQPCGVDGSRNRRVGEPSEADARGRDNRLVEHHQPARIDGIERHVRAIRLVEDGPNPLLVVELRQRVSVALARCARCRCVVRFGVSFVVSLPLRGSTLTAAIGGWQSSPSGRTRFAIGPVQPPAVRDGDDGLAFLADVAQEDRRDPRARRGSASRGGAGSSPGRCPDRVATDSPGFGNARIAVGILVFDRIARAQADRVRPTTHATGRLRSSSVRRAKVMSRADMPGVITAT